MNKSCRSQLCRTLVRSVYPILAIDDIMSCDEIELIDVPISLNAVRATAFQ